MVKRCRRVRRHRSVFEVGSIGILNKPSDVAVGIAQVLGKGVGSQEIKSIGKAFVQRCLECVVKHLELREVQRQDRSQVGLLVKVPPAKVRDAIAGVRPAEIGIQYLQRLVQITGFVVPQVICPGPDVSDLSQKVVTKLVLHAQVPFHDSGIVRSGPVVFTGPLILTARPPLGAWPEIRSRSAVHSRATAPEL